MTVTTTSGAATALPVEEFIDDLVREMRATKRPSPPRFWVAVYTGKASRAAIGRYACEQYAFSRHVVHSMAAALGAMYTLDHFCRRSAAEAVAAFSLATEARGDILSENRDGRHEAPPLSRTFAENYGLDDAALRFWRIHEEIEGDDAEQGFRMIRTYADGAHAQGLIRRAVRETSLTFDAMWHGFDRFLDA